MPGYRPLINVILHSRVILSPSRQRSVLVDHHLVVSEMPRVPPCLLGPPFRCCRRAVSLLPRAARVKDGRRRRDSCTSSESPSPSAPSPPLAMPPWDRHTWAEPGLPFPAEVLAEGSLPDESPLVPGHGGVRLLGEDRGSSSPLGHFSARLTHPGLMLKSLEDQLGYVGVGWIGSGEDCYPCSVGFHQHLHSCCGHPDGGKKATIHRNQP